MSVIARRSMLAGAGVAAAATLAALYTLRKPPAPHIVTLTPDTAPRRVHLQTLAALKPLDPPQKVPDLGFVDGDGATRHLRDLAGKGVVLNLWATWCGPCVAELPSLAHLAHAASGQGIVVLPLCTDRKDAGAVKAFYRKHGIAGLMAAADPTDSAADALNLVGLPTTFLLDRTGQARARLEGGADWGAPDALSTIRRLIG